MAQDNLPELNFPFSSVFQQHILDGCLAPLIERVDQVMMNRAADDLETAHKVSGSIRRKLQKELKEVSRGF